MLHCEARVFPVGTAYGGYMISQAFFSPRKTRMGNVTSGRFVLGRVVHCEFDY